MNARQRSARKDIFRILRLRYSHDWAVIEDHVWIEDFSGGYVVKFVIQKPSGLGHMQRARVAGFWYDYDELRMTFDQALDYNTALAERNS